MAGKGISIDQETKIVMLLARGDEYKDIMKQVDVSVNTITKVKRRNKDNLALIAEKVMEKALDDAAASKQKANKIISKRLDRDETNAEVLAKAQQDWIDDKITFKELEAVMRRFKEIGITELVTVSKEMHAQTSKGDDTPSSPKDLATLAAALASGDEVRITQAIFNAKSPNV